MDLVSFIVGILEWNVRRDIYHNPVSFYSVVPGPWKTRDQHLENGLSASRGSYVPLFDVLLAKHCHEKSGIWALCGFAWSAILCGGIIFDSIHQTVVAGFWILIRLAEKQAYLPAIREQWLFVVPEEGSISVKTLSQMTLLDSFIRDVFCTKGDSWGPVRQTTKPVQIGPYILPKNALCMVQIARAYQHPDNYVDDGKVFNSFQ